MKHKVWFDNHINAVCLELHGAFTAEDSPEFMSLIEEFYRDKNKRYLLCDLSGGGTKIPTERRYRKWLMDKYNQIGFHRIAILNAPPAMRMLAKVVLNTLHKLNQVKFFTSRRQAREWLRAEILVQTKDNK